jgi:hypothetical protein
MNDKTKNTVVIVVCTLFLASLILYGVDGGNWLADKFNFSLAYFQRTLPPERSAPISNVITVISPKGGETFYQHPARSIYMRWQVSALPSDWPNPLSVNADLYEYFPSTNTYVFVKLLEASIAKFDCGGYYVAQYPVPTNVPAGIEHSYVIKISSNSNPEKYYSYSGTFHLASQSASSKTTSVISPNGGEVWTKGTTQTIKWISEEVSQVHIWWAKGGGVPIPPQSGICFPSNISGGVVPNTGSFAWSIPSNLTTGNDYKVWIFGLDDGVDTSGIPFLKDGNFSVVSRIDISSPQEGEQWPEGENRNIRWSLSGVPSNTLMNVTLHRANDPNFSRIIAQSVNNLEGQFTWKIPNDLATPIGKPQRTDFYVSIEAKSNNQVVGKGASDQFTIYKPPIFVQ